MVDCIAFCGFGFLEGRDEEERLEWGRYIIRRDKRGRQKGRREEGSADEEGAKEQCTKYEGAEEGNIHTYKESATSTKSSLNREYRRRTVLRQWKKNNMPASAVSTSFTACECEGV